LLSSLSSSLSLKLLLTVLKDKFLIEKYMEKYTEREGCCLIQALPYTWFGGTERRHEDSLSV
jgi:hypothetical protein